jgi:hypothetical protein
MLADDRAQAFVSRFLFPWFALDKLSTANPDKKFFPDYDVLLRDAFARETELFLLSQLRDDRDPVELWSANYTFLNDRLARHYNVPNVKGSQFRKVTLSSPERSGLLGQGSVLMVTSRHSPDNAYTSPAARSIWVRLHFLGAPAPMPFPNASPVKPEFPITPQTRKLPVEPCMTCHRNFFPLGYALENFDPIGGWRTEDQAGPVGYVGHVCRWHTGKRSHRTAQGSASAARRIPHDDHGEPADLCIRQSQWDQLARRPILSFERGRFCAEIRARDGRR